MLRGLTDHLQIEDNINIINPTDAINGGSVC